MDRENRTGNILVVDDSPSILDVLRNTLEAGGYTIYMATSGEKALSRALQVLPDLILLDVLMPGMDGFETCRRLKADERTSGIPVIFMTGLTETTSKVKGFEAGGVDYVTKPFQQEEVLARVATHLKIRDLSRVLQEANESLEKRVMERTAELAQANASLTIEINERKRVERDLQQSEANYRGIIDNIQDIFYRIDLQGSLIMASPSILTLLGYESLTDCLGKPFAEMFCFEPQKQAKFLRQVRETGNVTNHEVVLRRRDGKPVVVETNSHIYYDGTGNFAGVEGMLRDLTERKRTEAERKELEDQLIQAQKMQSLGRLAGGVAHDFNNMLSVIQGYTEIVMGQLGPAHPLRPSLEEIYKAASRSAGLTRQLLAFARKQTISPQALDLNETVAGMINMLERLIGENIRINWQPEADLWPVLMDRSQLDQILANLCVNARQAITDIGQITIQTGKCIFDETYCASHSGFSSGEYVRLTVSDTGCGMNREVLAHIFEPFFTTKKAGEGTGLGLATVYGIVKQNNGFINVISEYGQGTEFTIYLPRHEGEVVHAYPEVAAGKALQGQETILLVEDEPILLKLTKMSLEIQGYQVQATSSPQEAIRLASEFTGGIHLLITDVLMPDMNGRDLAYNLLSLYPDLKCLFMSGYTAEIINQHRVLEKGVGFIQKPFSIQSLAAKVREMLDK